MMLWLDLFQINPNTPICPDWSSWSGRPPLDPDSQAPLNSLLLEEYRPMHLCARVHAMNMHDDSLDRNLGSSPDPHIWT